MLGTMQQRVCVWFCPDAWVCLFTVTPKTFLLIAQSKWPTSDEPWTVKYSPLDCSTDPLKKHKTASVRLPPMVTVVSLSPTLAEFDLWRHPRSAHLREGMSAPSDPPGNKPATKSWRYNYYWLTECFSLHFSIGPPPTRLHDPQAAHFVRFVIGGFLFYMTTFLSLMDGSSLQNLCETWNKFEKASECCVSPVMFW